MPDIFISYSSHDREHAELLTELLASAGLSVWIDKSALNAASSWSKEIVEAINGCKVFVVLLSPASLDSHNVIKEIALASEKRKKILPLDLEPVALTSDFEYQLAGIQRAPMSNIDSIIRALGKLGLEATGAPQAPKIVKEKSDKKSLMILPFEDLSPTGDNAWFADGIVSELISALSNVKALRVADQQATKDYKRYSGTLPVYAKETEIRYFVQGDVRKFGDNIKITARLLDIETGDHLWQDSMKGTMQDIFDIQEQVATKVVDGLNIILSKEEKSKLDEHGTENAEAYEYFMRASELFDLSTREGFLQAISLYDLAIKLDPFFVNAMLAKASSMILLFKYYEQNLALLREAELLLQKAEESSPGGWQVHDLLSTLYLAEGRAEDAEREHQEHIAKHDGSVASQEQLGFYCFHTKEYLRAFEHYDAALKVGTANDPWNAIINAHRSGNAEGLNRWSDLAISAFQRRLRLHPEDVATRVKLAATYFWSNPPQRAGSLREIELLESLPDLDNFIQYQVATLLAEHREDDRAVESLRKAISKGLKISSKIREADSPFAPLFGKPAFEELMKKVEGKQNV